MSDDVLCSVNQNGVATIVLNRPKALNSLTYDMVRVIGEKLTEWKTDHNVSVVIIKGAGPKGLCAGGDIKALYQARSSKRAMQAAERFFEKEYEADMAVYRFPKPIIACLDGIVMGGGVGLTYGASHRIVTERTKWAMPEMNIGFFPDVGAAYFFNKAPGHIGRYLALTASVIHAADVLYMNGADIYMESDALEQLIKKVEHTNWNLVKVGEKLDQMIGEFRTEPSQKSELSSHQKTIDHHFRFNTLEEILQSLDREESDFGLNIKKLLLSKSPFSLKIALKQLAGGKQKTLEECFATDLLLAKNFLRHSDFYEGVRSVLIDRDQSPDYEYKRVSDVSDEAVYKFFKPSESANFNLS
ncbi:3-hydroxyisobutyryl-CoA hydrolase [Bacillus glycinifermentans]|uniref:3-hydroxyisobutyryl-CoA hydrolase n=1 Tax=Bacillus glycinifermentans TaxID=1664069 RepID=A0A0J6EYH8_9BACI|nr:enoyl-CoA hydratase/isomerase family protein [Bacillus glycinifermentans]ATH91877.1 enoyl-CoA hydratase/isomerase family protein [Bacillus glycinifermentans]KMM62923.1 3-hydroxyisobutyryl-CoA hydrolase [Bacillus glycinifermentans]KRT92895.1 3-hydroxyisobutyryl-CoA hydrolase [Bacillus glycinifermentans]MEC0486265.1 enoyl-CoA hydratase/isomerase family protein [Bacillus glycinifermentans]MEC0494979.1 enoyl-CoA hydratase/isomerase family protein [Bacillus glycinifermentans]